MHLHTSEDSLYHFGLARSAYVDVATLAGLESAEAMLSGKRATFDQHFDPAEIGIRSAGKAFEFRIPDGVVDTSPASTSP